MNHALRYCSLYIYTDQIRRTQRSKFCPISLVAESSLFSSYLGTLSKDVFEPRTSTGSEAFSLFICLDANKLVLLSFFSLLKTIYPRVSTKSFPSDAKSPLPVDVRRPKTLLLKLPIVTSSDSTFFLTHTLAITFLIRCSLIRFDLTVS